MIKPHIVSDKNNLSLKIKKSIESKNDFYSLLKSNLIIVIGGDGFMLSTLKKYKKYKKPFYGINSGNYGFLMNKFSKNFSAKNLSKCRNVTISPLEMTVKTKTNAAKKSIAINEVSILRQSRQAASLSILNSSRDLLISWVHLSPKGNKKIAHAIYNKLYDIGLLDEELLVYWLFCL